MNSNHKNGENNTPLEDELGKISQAYGRMEHEEPPELLDQAILNSAHRAVEKQPHWTQFGWLHGLTTAAVVVLAISIILRQSEPVPVYEDDTIGNKPKQIQLQKASKKESGEQLMELRREIKLKTEPADKDNRETGIVAEEVQFEAAEAMSDSPQTGALSRQASPAAIAEPAKSDMSVLNAVEAEAVSEADTELQAIISLKQAGDESWRKELELFLQRYPNYPLPDGLKD